MPIKPDFDAADAAEDWIFNQKPPSLRKAVLDLLSKVWDESKHKRVPGGSPEGGRFTNRDGQVTPDAPREGPGFLMRDVPKSWQHFNGRATQVGQAGEGHNKPVFLRIEREDGTVVQAVEKMLDNNQEQSNELLAYKLSQILDGPVPPTELSGNSVRQEFMEGDTLTEEISRRLGAMPWQDILRLHADRIPGGLRGDGLEDLNEDNQELWREGLIEDLAFEVSAYDWDDLLPKLENMEAAIIDFVMNQHDRNTGNMLYGADGKLWLIDNGNTGDPEYTHDLSDGPPQKSPFIEATMGWALNAKQRAALTTVKESPAFPMAVRFRAGYLLEYNKMPSGEFAARDLWNEMMYQHKTKTRRP